uniref:Large ribosomal subunit protein bL19c n=1 Tax=Alsidium seaforthii TaxID=2007182 RepID=A0A1Z1MDS4_9FLOR|nr:ribosomal protein L19 [Bryothamnion seaforthii]ARW64022.1 ribosomal protein L19 [Bryothamnion seaforthii]
MIKNKSNYRAIIKEVERDYLKSKIPLIEVGDNIRVKKIIQEGTKQRTQTSEGVVIAKKNSSLNTTITIRKIIQNIGVEKIYLVHSPQILQIEIIRKSKIRKSKLYYLRNRSGKATRLKPRINR